METSFYADTNAWAAGFIADMFRALTAGGMVTAAGILMLTAACSYLAVCRNRNRAYLSGDIKRTVWHWLLIPLGIVSALFVLLDIRVSRIIGAAIMLIAVAAAYFVARRRTAGPFLAASVVWASCAAGAAVNISLAAGARRDMDTYSAIGKFSLYGASDILVMRSLGLLLLAGAATVMYVRFYVRNRYVLLPHYRDELKDADRCSCGYPYLSGNDYCPNCGKKAGTVRSRTELEILDDPLFCVKCSAKLNKRGVCPECGNETFRKAMKQEAADVLKGYGIKIAAFVIIALFILVPYLAGNLYKGLSSGVDQAVRNFETKTVEYINEPGVKQDESWRAGFTDSYNAVYDLDLRIFDVYLRRISQDDLKYYIRFGEQAFSRECLMENLWYAVKADDVPTATELIIAVDNTRTEQANALNEALSDALSLSDTPLSTFAMVLTNGFRFYTSFITLWLFGAALILAAAVVFLVSRRSAAKHPLPVPAFDTGEGTGVRTAYTAADRKQTLVAILIVILVFAVTAGVGFLKDRNNGPDFAVSFENAVMKTGGEVLSVLADREDPDPEALKDACRRQEEALAVLKQCEADGALEETILDMVPQLESALQELIESGAGDADAVSGYVTAQMQIMQMETVYNINTASDTIGDMF